MSAVRTSLALAAGLFASSALAGPRGIDSTIGQVAQMPWNAQVTTLAGRHGLSVVNVTWEDTGRFNNSAVGPNISDMTIGVRDANGALHPMPVFRFDNFNDKTADMLEAARILTDLGFDLIATRGTQAWLEGHGVPCAQVNKVYEGRPDIVDMMKDGQIQLVMNTTEGAAAVEDSKSIRTVALMDKIPYFTTAAGAHAAALAIKAQAEGDVVVKSLQA